MQNLGSDDSSAAEDEQCTEGEEEAEVVAISTVQKSKHDNNSFEHRHSFQNMHDGYY